MINVAINAGDANDPSVCGSGGNACNTGGQINFNDWYATTYNIINNPDSCSGSSWGTPEMARTLIHETFHNAGLCHTFTAGNNCDDIIAGWECKNVGGTGVQPGCGEALDTDYCEGWGVVNSDNLMSYGTGRTTLSRCQWSIVYRNIASGAHNLSDICEVDDTPLIIQTGTTQSWNNTVRFMKNKEIIIETGATLNINSTQVRLAKGAIIKVQRGAKLNIDNSTLTNICNEKRWGGIYVEGNSQLNQPVIDGTQTANQAGIVNITNSTLTHSSFALNNHRANENWNSAYYGGLIVCNGVDFIDNKKGIAFYKYTKQDNSRIINSTFEASGNSTFPAYGGVSVWSCRGIEFSGNTFNNLDYGILPYNSKIRVLDDNNFTNLTVGIDIYSTHPNASEDIIGNVDTGVGNSFSNNGHHIQINAGNGGGYSVIRHNNFVNASLPSIIMDGEHTLSVIENYFSNDIFAFLSRNTTQGIVAFECNNVNSSVGFFAQGRNDNLIFSANDFDTGSADAFIESYGGNSGSVFTVQGLKDGFSTDYSASNFFNHSNSMALDIVTLGETVPFRYINPTESPSEYTPEVLDNNYFLDPLNKEADECEDIAIGRFVGKPPYDVVKLDDIRQIEALAKLEKEAYPNDAEKERYYAEAARAKEKVLTWLVKEAIGNSEYASAENYLSVETDKMRWFTKSGHFFKIV